MAAELALAFVLVAANGFFVAVEFSVARLRPTQARELLRQGRPGAKSVAHAVDHIDAYLSACQLGITMSSLGLGALGEPAFHDLLEPVLGDAATIGGFGLAAALAFLIITTLHVVVGELSPKSLAIARTAPVVLALAPPMRAFYLSTKPLVDLFNAMGNLLLRPFGVPPASEAGHQPHSEAELRELLRHSLREGLIDPSDAELSERAFMFGDRQAHEVLTPRPEVVALGADTTPEDALDDALHAPYSRFPVCEESLDHVVGVVHLRDLAAAAREHRAKSIRALVRPAHLVPETKDLAELLRELQRRGEHMALVLDEYGGLAGLVTLEDLIEEIVGEIEDEYDLPTQEVELLDDDRARIDGTMAIETFNERFGRHLPAEQFHTLAGFVFDALGRGAQPGDEVTADGVRLKVVETDGPRIARLEARFEQSPRATPTDA
jgi:CBS domain containing-hemolysin-like protein